MWGPTPCRASRSGRGCFDQRGELVVEAGAVGVDGEHPATEELHRQLGGVQHRVSVAVGAQRSSTPSDEPGRDVAEPFPQLIGGGDAEMTELVEQPDAGLAPGTGSHEQHPDRFHVAVGTLGHPLGPAAQRRPSRLHGVDGVGLAVAAASLPVGAINLDHRNPGAAQEAGQPGPVGAGALDTDPGHRAEAAQPGVQLGEPGRCRRERPTPNTPPLASIAAAT